MLMKSLEATALKVFKLFASVYPLAAGHRSMYPWPPSWGVAHSQMWSGSSWHVRASPGRQQQRKMLRGGTVSLPTHVYPLVLFQVPP